jgi:hypothetical protein
MEDLHEIIKLRVKMESGEFALHLKNCIKTLSRDDTPLKGAICKMINETTFFRSQLNDILKSLEESDPATPKQEAKPWFQTFSL